MKQFTKEYGGTIISVVLVLLVIIFTMRVLRSGEVTSYGLLSDSAEEMAAGVGNTDTTYTDYSKTTRTKPEIALVEGATFVKGTTYNMKDYLEDTSASAQTILSANILNASYATATTESGTTYYNYAFTDEEDMTSYTRPDANTTDGSVSTFTPSKSGIWRLTLSVVTKDSDSDNQRSNVVIYATVE